MLSALVGSLALSRSTFVRCSENKKVETLVQAHKRFFDAIPGTPHTFLSDNMKTVLTDSKRCAQTALITDLICPRSAILRWHGIGAQHLSKWRRLAREAKTVVARLIECGLVSKVSVDAHKRNSLYHMGMQVVEICEQCSLIISVVSEYAPKCSHNM